MGVGVGRVQAVDVAQQHQQVGFAAAGHDGGQGVVVADGRDLVGGHSVVFVDDGQGPQLQQPVQRGLKVDPPVSMLHVHAGEQDLRNGVIVGIEEPVVGIHQLTLTHCGTGLLAGGVLWTLRQRQLAHAHANGTGRYQNDLVALIFQIAQHLDQLLRMADVQPSGAVCQSRGAYLHNDAHKSINPFPFPLSCRKRRARRPSPRPAGRALPARARPEWCCRRGCTRRP